LRSALRKAYDWELELALTTGTRLPDFEDDFENAVNGTFRWSTHVVLGSTQQQQKALELWHRIQRAEEELHIIKEEASQLIFVLDAMLASLDAASQEIRDEGHPPITLFS
jgi:hypothetical protein